MKYLVKTITMITILLSPLMKARAVVITPYTPHEIQSILMVVRNVMSADEKQLYSSHGPYKAQVLHQELGSTEGASAPQFVGYGNSIEEAQARAGFICIRWKCSQLNSQKNEWVKSIENYSPEKIMDLMRAQGRMDLVSDDPNLDKNAYKESILNALRSEVLSCDVEKTPQSAITSYALCMASGFRVSQ